MEIIGVHVTKKSSVLDLKSSKLLSSAIVRDLDAYDLNAAQIFTHGPKVNSKNPIKRNKWNAKLIKNNTKDIDLSVHSCYITTLVWKENKSTHKFAINIFHDQLKAAKEINAWGLVLHVTKIKPQIIAHIMKKYLLPLAEKTGVMIILEMVASKASNITYETPEKINNVSKLIGDGHYGWCIDTAHIWGAGVDIREYKKMNKWLNAIKAEIVMFHLNGSECIRGSGKDKHAIVFDKTDLIWRNIDPHLSGAAAVLKYARKYNIPVILEINRGSQIAVASGIKKINRIYDTEQ